MRNAIRVALTTALVGTALSAPVDPANAEAKGDVAVGKQLYMKNCATCHGPSATGDGVAATTFKNKPTNLTLLSKENGGTFPTMKVIGIVKGDSPVAAHGNREMPVWGEIIGRPLDTPMYGQDDADLKILSITDYLKSIQQQ